MHCQRGYLLLIPMLMASFISLLIFSNATNPNHNRGSGGGGESDMKLLSQPMIALSDKFPGDLLDI
jgi:hypothetical protein